MPWIELPYETDPPDRIYALRDEGLPPELCHRDGDEVTVRVGGESVRATWDAESLRYVNEDGEGLDVEAVWV